MYRQSFEPANELEMAGIFSSSAHRRLQRSWHVAVWLVGNKILTAKVFDLSPTLDEVSLRP